jgi:hypothetical protein
MVEHSNARVVIGNQAERVCSAVIAAAMGVGCAHYVPLSAPNAVVESERAIVLNGYPIKIQLAEPAGNGNRPLLLYATGDGGWRRTDLDTYHELISWGYPVAAFSSPDYLRHLDKGLKTTTPADLADDYRAIIDAAKAQLMLAAGTPVILAGVSRGANLAVVAAGQETLQHELGGVVAVALTNEEEHVRWYREIRLRPGQPRVNVPVTLQVYEYLPRLGTLPISVVQSTGDKYLPAGAAQELFGPNTDRRQFHAIRSRNHSFSDARATMQTAIQTSLAWIDDLLVGDGRR